MTEEERREALEAVGPVSQAQLDHEDMARNFECERREAMTEHTDELEAASLTIVRGVLARLTVEKQRADAAEAERDAMREALERSNEWIRLAAHRDNGLVPDGGIALWIANRDTLAMKKSASPTPRGEVE